MKFYFVIGLVECVICFVLDLDVFESGIFIYNENRYRFLCVIVFYLIFIYLRNVLGVVLSVCLEGRYGRYFYKFSDEEVSWED